MKMALFDPSSRDRGQVVGFSSLCFCPNVLNRAVLGSYTKGVEQLTAR